MKNIRKHSLWLVGLMVFLIVAQGVGAQSGGGYNLGWSSIAGGGGVSSGGGVVLRGSIGQASAAATSGGGYTLVGGFWGRPVTLSSVTSPPNGGPVRNYFASHQVTLTWNQITWATAYQVQVSRNIAFTNLVYPSPELDANTLSLTLSIPENGIYYWHVRAKANTGRWGAWSRYDSFVVNPPW